eukprot:2608719-Pyramimonas_sp.AAC.1
MVGRHYDSTRIAASLAASQDTTSTTVEITALIWAIAWTLFARLDRTVTIYSDSLTAIQLAARQAFSDRDTELVNLMCILYDLAADTIRLEHVHAHEMHPWNEIADTAANHARLVAVGNPQQSWADIFDNASQRNW